MSRLKRNQVSNFENPEMSNLKNIRLQNYPDENQESSFMNLLIYQKKTLINLFQVFLDKIILGFQNYFSYSTHHLMLYNQKMKYWIKTIKLQISIFLFYRQMTIQSNQYKNLKIKFQKSKKQYLVHQWITRKCIFAYIIYNQQIIDFSVYLRYFKYWSCLAFFLVILMEFTHEILTMLYQRVISLFEYYQDLGQTNSTFIILSSLIIGQLVCCFIKYLLNVIQVSRTTQNIHQKMLNSIILAQIQYFDINPSGRIINKFSNDLSLCDNSTNQVCLDILELIGNFFIALITLAILQPQFIFMICFIIILNLYQYNFYNKIVSQLKVNELIQRSLLFDFIEKTAGGSIQIRVYEQQDMFKKQFLDLSNKYLFALTLIFIGFLASSVGLFIFLNLNSNDFAISSQGLLLLITFNDGLSLGLKQLINFASQMSSYNRMFQIIDVESEARQANIQILSYPIFQNQIILNLIIFDYHYKYKVEKRLIVLVELEQENHRFYKPSLGCVKLKTVNIQKLKLLESILKQAGLQKLRSSIGIIPQFPFLFTRSLRSNLDLFDQYVDQAIWKALEVTGLIDYARSFSKGLLTDICDVNSFFSLGQKQLICLARILLQIKKIIVLDEATANLDMKTDFIQNTLKQQLKQCTLITIAHRLNTIADYDKVMVFENGNAIEFDQPFFQSYGLITQFNNYRQKNSVISTCFKYWRIQLLSYF